MDDDVMTEECTECGRETAHEVCIRLLTESGKEKNAEFSREPYRVATCQVCGAEEFVRMNNA
jgi:predicted nucleic-acid-binding Zn-ribbon protein